MTSHLQRIQNYAARVILRLTKSSSITIHLKHDHSLRITSLASCQSKKHMQCTLFVLSLSQTKQHHHMSLTCCRKSHHTPAILVSAHTPCLFSIDLYTVQQHLVIARFLLLLLLSGTLIQIMSDVPHHCHNLWVI